MTHLDLLHPDTAARMNDKQEKVFQEERQDNLKLEKRYMPRISVDRNGLQGG